MDKFKALRLLLLSHAVKNVNINAWLESADNIIENWRSDDNSKYISNIIVYLLSVDPEFRDLFLSSKPREVSYGNKILVAVNHYHINFRQKDLAKAIGVTPTYISRNIKEVQRRFKNDKEFRTMANRLINYL